MTKTPANHSPKSAERLSVLFALLFALFVSAADEPVASDSPEVGCRRGQVDINNASRDELTAILHIGPERAKQLVRQRPYRRLSGLTRISGIAQARLADIRSQGVACVGRPKRERGN